MVVGTWGEELDREADKNINDKKGSQTSLILIKLIKKESQKCLWNLSRRHREEFPCFLSMMTKKGAATMTKIPAPYLCEDFTGDCA